MGSNDALKARARRAYEIGRLARAARFGLYPIPLIAISTGLCGSPLTTGVAGGLLIVLAVLFAWRGQTLEAAVGPGMVSGLGAFSLPLAGEALGLCGTGNPAACALLCFGGGALTGLFLGARAGRHPQARGRFLAAGALIAGLVGALGCVIAGVGGVAGMVLGVTAISTPVMFMRRV